VACVDHELRKSVDKLHRSFTWWLSAAVEHSGLRMTRF
jgi:hypothetical protein